MERAIRAAEDARRDDSASLAPIFEGLSSGDVSLQFLAARALGRFEHPRHRLALRPLLRSNSSELRAEAAQALAQSVSGPPARDSAERRVAVAETATWLLDAFARETDPSAAAALARSIGRLPYGTMEPVRRAEQALLVRLAAPGDTTAYMGALLGLESLIRTRRSIAAPGGDVILALREAAALQAVPARARRLAMTGLQAAARIDASLVREAIRDPDAQVRRIAVAALATLDSVEDREDLVRGALADLDQSVRIEAVRTFARRAIALDCTLLARAARDSAIAVAIAAIDAIPQAGARCSSPDGELRRIVLAATHALPPGRSAQAEGDPGVAAAARAALHRGAHAIVALARIEPDTARGLLARFEAHESWIARSYAARAATVVQETGVLVRLTADGHSGVRAAALEGLNRIAGHQFDDLYVRALADPDYNVVLSAAGALRQSPGTRSHVPALRDALERITLERRETSRDPRVAILERLREFGAPSDSSSLLRYESDFDPAVADLAARIRSAWTGRTITANPRRLPPADTLRGPVDSLAGLSARVTMSREAGGGVFEIRLLAREAPYSAARFVRLAREGYYDGLTFHRVAPNFVVQGGSPGANEYVGDGPFMRDEIWLHSHERGTVGVSTRGRDTGDAQIFINLVDSPRLDFDYTVFARVVSGMAVVDRILEGDVIEKVEVLPAR